jgi:glycosyltransferase involved in cell wall biosynthesis
MTLPPIVHIIDHMGLGGAQRVVADIAARQARAGWPVSLISLRGPTPLVERLRAAGVGVCCLGLRSWDPRQLTALTRALRALRPRLAHLHLMGAHTIGRLAARAAGVPALVVHDHEASAEIYTHPGPLLAARRLLEPGASPGSTRYLVLTAEAATYAVSIRRWPRQSVSVLPNGVDLDYLDGCELDQGAARRSLALPERAPLIVSAGRLSPVKGYDLLLEAMALLPSAAHLALAGDGPEIEALRARAARSDLAGRVHLLGGIADVRPLLRAGDLYVQPSRREAFGLAAAEAAASGLAVVACAVGGLREIVHENRTGRLVPPEQPALLAAAVRGLLADEQRARQLAAAGRAHVRQQFAIAAIVERLDSIYATLL